MFSNMNMLFSSSLPIWAALLYAGIFSWFSKKSTPTPIETKYLSNKIYEYKLKYFYLPFSSRVRAFVSVRLSVCLSDTSFKRMHILSNFFFVWYGHHLILLAPSPLQNFKGNPSVRRQIPGGGIFFQFAIEIAVYLGNGVRNRPMVTMDH